MVHRQIRPDAHKLEAPLSTPPRKVFISAGAALLRMACCKLYVGSQPPLKLYICQWIYALSMFYWETGRLSGRNLTPPASSRPPYIIGVIILSGTCRPAILPGPALGIVSVQTRPPFITARLFIQVYFSPRIIRMKFFHFSSREPSRFNFIVSSPALLFLPMSRLDACLRTV